MKPPLLVFGLIFLAGCVGEQYQTQYQQQYQYQPDEGLIWLEKRLSQLKERRDNVFALAKQTREREANFITTLDDDQLLAYQNAKQHFNTNDLPTQELLKRNLMRNFDANTYPTVVDLLEKNKQIQKEIIALENEHASLVEWAEEKKEKADLKYELMMRDSMRGF